MRYLSIDSETTGLDENKHQMIEFAAIIEDSNNPKSYADSKKYRRVLLSSDGNYNFSSYAAKINAGLIQMISDFENGKAYPLSQDENLTQLVMSIDLFLQDFRVWLLANGFRENERGIIEVVVAAKNPSFDRKFVYAIPDFESYGIRFHHRLIDPTLDFIDWSNDIVPPSTEKCKERAGLPTEVKHEALADAWDVIQLLRTNYVFTPQ